MEVSSSPVADENLQPTGIPTYICLLHGKDGLVTYRLADPALISAAELYLLREKLQEADEGNDIYLYGRVNGRRFTATSVREGGKALTEDDFIMFCEALEIPYEIAE